MTVDEYVCLGLIFSDSIGGHACVRSLRFAVLALNMADDGGHL